MKLAPGAAKSAELDGARLPSADSLRRELPALVFTPDRLAVVKGGPGGTARVLRPRRSGGSSRRAQALRRSTPPRSPSATPSLRRVQLGFSTPRRTRALDGARRRARRDARRARAARSPRARAGLRRARRRARPPGGRRSPTTASRRPRPRSRRGSTRDLARGTHRRSGRIWTTCASSPATATCGASARRASSGSRCSRSCSPRPSCCPRRRCSCSTTCSRSSTRRRRRVLADADRAAWSRP